MCAQIPVLNLEGLRDLGQLRGGPNLQILMKMQANACRPNEGVDAAVHINRGQSVRERTLGLVNHVLDTRHDGQGNPKSIFKSYMQHRVPFLSYLHMCKLDAWAWLRIKLPQQVVGSARTYA
jgi:hypothetical protein